MTGKPPVVAFKSWLAVQSHMGGAWRAGNAALGVGESSYYPPSRLAMRASPVLEMSITSGWRGGNLPMGSGTT